MFETSFLMNKSSLNPMIEDYYDSDFNNNNENNTGDYNHSLQNKRCCHHN